MRSRHSCEQLRVVNEFGSTVNERDQQIERSSIGRALDRRQLGMMALAMGDMIKVSLTLGLLAVMFAQGLNLSRADLGGFRRQPGTLARAFLAVDVLVPLGTIAVVAIFRPPLPIVVCLALMACSPMAAFGLRHVVDSPRLRPVWSGVYLVLLLAALVTTPVTLVLLGKAFGFSASVSPMAIAGKVLGTIALPVGVGMLVRRWRPAAAPRLSAALQKAGALLIVLPFLVLVAANWRAFGDFGLRGYLAVGLFVLLALTWGHLLGGKDPEARTLLANESATRNPAFALLIAHTSFPDARIFPVLVPYLVAYLLIKSAYGVWRRHHVSGAGRGTPSAPHAHP